MINEVLYCLKTGDVRKLKNCFKSILPDRYVSNAVFKKHHNRRIDEQNPTLLDEKLLILKDGLYRNNTLVTNCTDKYEVREYVRSKGYGDALVRLIGSYRSTDEIDWDALPDKFVLKCNHGSGYNIIVTDKKTTDRKEAYRQLRAWMKQDYATISAEHHYHDISHRILIEEYIQTKAGKFPVDYKFFCSRGKVICMLLVAGRGTKKVRVYVDRDFRDLQLIDEYRDGNLESLRPASFDRMIGMAEKLSEDFPLVRVDLYDRDGEVLFGELTFTPHGCCHDYLDEKAQKWIGDRVTL